MTRGQSNPRRAILVVVVALACASVAGADIGEPGTPDDLWSRWSFDPVIVGGLLVAGTLHGIGVSRLWGRAGRGRGVAAWRVAAFYAGLLFLALALVSPLDALAEALFSAHMVQHLILVAVAGPLVAAGKPLVVGAWSVPSRTRPAVARVLRWPWGRRVGSVLVRPLVAVVLHAATLWIWHMPALYEAALEHEIVHRLEHGMFFGTSVLLWAALFRECGPGLRILFLFASATQSAVLGALITFAPTPWYTIHEAGARAWGIGLLEDQQLAGLIMWIPGGVVYVAAALWSFARWMTMSERAVLRRERARDRTWRESTYLPTREPSERRETDATKTRGTVGAGPVHDGV